MKFAIILRGPSGSGKSTTACKIREYLRDFHVKAAIVSADDYFIRGETIDGVYRESYQFDRTKLGAAHLWCRDRFKTVIEDGIIPILDNTNTTQKECEPYISYCLQNGVIPFVVEVDRPFPNHGNVHGVPAETVAAQSARFEATWVVVCSAIVRSI